MNILIAIPARLESTRLPRKLLLAETGKPLIQHTVEASLRLPHRVELLSDSDLLMNAVRDCDLRLHTWYSTESFSSGTERIAAFLETKSSTPDLIINWQADEPELKPEHIDELIRQATMVPGCDMATLAHHWESDNQDNPSIVKVHYQESSTGGWAGGFSRLPTEFNAYGEWHDHIGIYAYTPAFLRWYVQQPPTAGEQRESLEQLRALDAGCRIRVGLVDHPYRGIDTREDYEAFVARNRT